MHNTSETTADEKSLTVKEAVRFLDNVHPTWLYRRIGKPGGPPYRRRGRSVKFPRTAFLEWARQPILP